jgi:hypothetical protein
MVCTSHRQTGGTNTNRIVVEPDHLQCRNNVAALLSVSVRPSLQSVHARLTLAPSGVPRCRLGRAERQTWIVRCLFGLSD